MEQDHNTPISISDPLCSTRWIPHRLGFCTCCDRHLFHDTSFLLGYAGEEIACSMLDITYLISSSFDILCNRRLSHLVMFHHIPCLKEAFSFCFVFASFMGLVCNTPFLWWCSTRLFLRDLGFCSSCCSNHSMGNTLEEIYAS